MASIARTIALDLLLKWENGRIDPQSLAAQGIDKTVETRDAGFVRELLFGVIRYRRKLDHYISQFAQISRIPLPIKTILRIGSYQLLMTPNIPQYAVVSESVELAKARGKPRADGFVNAILRNIIRNQDKIAMPDIDADPVSYLGLQYSYPDWMVKRYLKRFGFEETSRLLQAGNEPAPVCFYVNRMLADNKSLMEELQAAGIEARVIETFPDYYECDNPSELIRSAAFTQGKIVIADPAQSLAVDSLELRSGAEVWDMFASPGGKTINLANKVGRGGVVFASDRYPDRIELLISNTKRCQLENVHIFLADILTFATKRKFGYILADVPCSCSGTMRRNPDLRWRLEEKDIAKLAANQYKLLMAASAMLADGGRLVYSTCSLEPEENQQVIDKFLASNKGFRLARSAGFERYRDSSGMIATLPSRDNIDGVSVAALEKIG
jgi:16S rRNA (cytosine967-C5)-methyltransferase